MAKIDLLSDALNFSEESKEEKKKEKSSAGDEFTFDDSLLDLNIPLDDDNIPSGESPIPEENISEEISIDEEQKADLHSEDNKKRMKLNLLSDDNLLEQELDSLVMEEAKISEKGESELVEEEAPEKTNEEETNSEETFVDTPATEEGENAIRPNPFYQPEEEVDTATESEQYEYDSFDEDLERERGSKKSFIFIILAILIIGAAGYYFFIYSKSTKLTETVVKKEQPAQTPETVPTKTAEVIRKQQQIVAIWQKSNGNTRALYSFISQLVNLSNSGYYITQVRKDIENISITVVADNRDQLASFNRELRMVPGVGKIKYVNVSDMNIGNSIKMVADIEFPVAFNPALSNLDFATHQKTTISNFKNNLPTIAPKSFKFDFQAKNMNPVAPYKQYQCSLSGKTSYSSLSNFLGKIISDYPQIDLQSVKIYSRGFRPLSSSKVKYYLSFTFTESNL